MNIFRFVFLLAFFFCFSQGFSQDKFNDKFNDANLLMEEKLYAIALPVWLEILQTDTGNANWNYKVGICYLNSGNERARSLPYLEKAALKTVKNYNPFSPAEDHAPIDAYYYLAKSYHLNSQFDAAIEYYEKFKTLAGKKHFLIPEVDLGIQMCNNAREIMSKPLTVNITNIGDVVNTPAPEYGPLISLDERALYFTSRRLWLDSSNADIKDRADGNYFEDIYVSYKDMSGKWGNPEMLNFNRRDDHEATVSLSPDGQTLFLYMDDGGDGNLYQSFLFGETWTAPVPLDPGINTKSQETHMTVSLDNKTLYFVSDRKGGIGGKDIYFCTRLPNGKWSQPQNIGTSINTSYDEDGPFIHPDGKTLYFSSKGHKSMGGYDIFMSVKKEDGTWAVPENMGYPINTTDDDIFFIISPDGKRAYYSSFRSDGFGDKDIYMVEQPQAMEKQLALIKGYITVPEGQEMPEDVSIIITNNETGEFVTEIKPLKRNGSFVFVIPPGKNYNISYAADGAEFYNENVYVPLNSDYKEVDKIVALNPKMLGTPEAVKIDVLSSTEKPKPDWQIRFSEPGHVIPDSSYIHYLNADGSVIYEELLSKSGFFNYYELERSQPYIFTLKNKDNPLCRIGEIVLFGKEDSMKFLPDSNCIFRQYKEQRPHFIYSAQLPRDITAQYLDASGNVLFEEKMDSTGFFSYHEFPDEKSYIIKLKPDDPALCGKGEINIPRLSDTALTLSPDSGCIYRVKEKKSSFIYDTLKKAVPAGVAVQYISDEGKLIEETKLDSKGEFKYRELSVEKPYAVVLKTKDRTLCEQGEILVPGPGGAIYTMVADENCVFRYKEKKSQFIYSDLKRSDVKGLVVQAIDDDGKIIFEEKMDEYGQFSYSKLPVNRSFTLKIKSDDSLVYKNSEIIIPVVGKMKAYYKFTPDSSGLFRMKEADDEKVVSKIFIPDLKKDHASVPVIQVIDDDGKLIYEEQISEKGEFSYEKIPVSRKFSLKIKSDDSLEYKKAEIIIPAARNTYIRLTPDQSGIFRMDSLVDMKLLVQNITEEKKEKQEVKTEEKEKQMETGVKKEEKPSVQPGTIVFEKTIVFDYDKSNISDQYKAGLNEAVKLLKENPSFKIEVSGHTDSKGTDEYNNALSERRARSAAKYLSSKGISGSRIVIKGFGEGMPIAPNVHPDGSDNPEGRQKNRRIEIKVSA